MEVNSRERMRCVRSCQQRQILK